VINWKNSWFKHLWKSEVKKLRHQFASSKIRHAVNKIAKVEIKMFIATKGCFIYMKDNKQPLVVTDGIFIYLYYCYHNGINLTTMTAVFWDVTPCSLVYKLHFRGIYSRHLHSLFHLEAGSSTFFWNVGTVHNHQTTRRHIPLTAIRPMPVLSLLRKNMYCTSDSGSQHFTALVRSRNISWPDFQSLFNREPWFQLG
jgi:hypothetical protein